MELKPHHPIMKKAHRKIYIMITMPGTFQKAGPRSSPPSSRDVESKQSETPPPTSRKERGEEGKGSEHQRERKHLEHGRLCRMVDKG